MRKEIEKMINDEYGNAIENYGKFHSLREAESVLREEIEEARDEVWEIRKHYECLWRKIKRNQNLSAFDNFEDIVESATMAIEELVQVAAVCQKALNLRRDDE